MLVRPVIMAASSLGMPLTTPGDCSTMTIGTLALIPISVSLSALAQLSFKLGVSSVGSSAGGTAGPAGEIMHALLTSGVLAGLSCPLA